MFNTDIIDRLNKEANEKTNKGIKQPISPQPEDFRKIIRELIKERDAYKSDLEDYKRQEISRINTARAEGKAEGIKQILSEIETKGE